MGGDYDIFLLVDSTKGIIFKSNGHKHPPHTLNYTKREFYRYYQTWHTTNPQYLETFNNNLSVSESYGGVYMDGPGTHQGIADGYHRPNII